MDTHIMGAATSSADDADATKVTMFAVYSDTPDLLALDAIATLFGRPTGWDRAMTPIPSNPFNLKPDTFMKL